MLGDKILRQIAKLAQFVNVQEISEEEDHILKTHLRNSKHELKQMQDTITRLEEENEQLNYKIKKMYNKHEVTCEQVTLLSADNEALEQQLEEQKELVELGEAVKWIYETGGYIRIYNGKNIVYLETLIERFREQKGQ